MFDLGTTILASAERNPNEIAIAGVDYKFTYSEWFKKIDALSGSLKHYGLKKQEKVVTLLQNNFEASRGSDFHSLTESRFDVGEAPPLPYDTVPVWARWL